jgi:hypothetical protein
MLILPGGQRRAGFSRLVVNRACIACGKGMPTHEVTNP